MNATETPTTRPTDPVSAPAGFASTAVDASFREPLLLVFISAAAWLLLSSVLGLIASIKFHGPNFLADTAWLTYGRVRPAAFSLLIYGFCVPVGLGVSTWIMARLGRSLCAVPGLFLAGNAVWNVGVALGLFGILRGDATGFEFIEFPQYAAAVLFCGYALMGISSVLTFHYRAERDLFVSHWFLLAAVFWFPWILSTAILLLMGNPVRGVTQSVIAWWYGANLELVWMSLVGLGIVFYLVPKVTGRLLEGRYTAMFGFWVLLLAGPWTGIPSGAPVPAWLPALSTVAVSLVLLLYITVALILFNTVQGKCSLLWGALSLRFVYIGVSAFLLAGIVSSFVYAPVIGQYLEYTWVLAGKHQLQVFGFMALVLFGAVYFILPQITEANYACMRLARAHLWLAMLGLLLGALPLVAGGIMEGIKLRNPDVPFLDVMRATLHFLRISTIGDLLILAGNALLLYGLVRAALRFYRVRAQATWRDALAEVKPAGVKS